MSAEVKAADDAVGDCLDAFQVCSEAMSMTSWTCREAEAMYAAIAAVGATQEAEWFMIAHAESDSADEGDRHEALHENPQYPHCATGWRYRAEEDGDE